MCLLVNMSGNIFKWRKRRQLSSDMDSRFGDVSISSPNEGSWNEMAYTQSIQPQPPETHKAGRLKALFRSSGVEPPVYRNALQPPQPATVVRAERLEVQVPHHPMVDIRAHKRSMSAEGRRTSGGQRTNSGQDIVSHESQRNIVDVLDSSSSCSCDGDDEDEEERRIRRHPRQRSQSQDSRSHHHMGRARRETRQQHRSPPLSSTAVMRRNSAQSTAPSSVTNSTPSTATFSSRRTSTTSAVSHSQYQPSIPPRLQEEVPPVPSMSPSSRWGKKSRAKSSSKRPTGSSIGPQELVPSQDELWGY